MSNQVYSISASSYFISDTFLMLYTSPTGRSFLCFVFFSSFFMQKISHFLLAKELQSVRYIFSYSTYQSWN